MYWPLLSSFPFLLTNVCRHASCFATFAIEVGPFVSRTHPNSPDSRLAHGLSTATVRRGSNREMALSCVPPLHLPELLQPPRLKAEFHPDIHITTDQESPSTSNLLVPHLSLRLPTPTSHKREPQAAAKARARRSSRTSQKSSLHSLGGNAVPKTIARARRMSETEEEEPDPDPTPRAVKRMKLKLGTQPSPPSRMVVRLKLPPKSKGKEREEEEPRGRTCSRISYLPKIEIRQRRRLRQVTRRGTRKVEHKQR
jgi:hypothetical protein